MLPRSPELSRLICATATALVGLTIFTFCTQNFRNLAHFASTCSGLTRGHGDGHVAAAGNLFLLPLPTRASSKTLPNSGCTDNHITFLSHGLKQEAACCCTSCMFSIPCCSGSPTARWSRHLVKDDTSRHIPMHAKNVLISARNILTSPCE